jgi:hypothetical protein
MPDNQLSGALFDPYRFGSEMNVNSKFASSLNELIHEIRVEEGKRTRATRAAESVAKLANAPSMRRRDFDNGA